MRDHVRIELRLLDEPLHIDAPAPAAHARLDELLPLMHAIDDAAIGRAASHSAAEGRPVSCRKGCSACCRAQPVPVTPPEAFALLRLVEAMPPPRQATVRARFAGRVQALHEAGLAHAFLERAPELDADGARSLAQRYFDLGLACPFLEDDACSIHPQRPFVCRQYLVTSPAALCADPFANAVAVLPVPLRAATAMLAATEAALGAPQHTVPLVLALEYAQAHRDALATAVDSEPVVRRWLQAAVRSEDNGSRPWAAPTDHHP